MEQPLFRHNKPGRSVTFDEYRAEGGFLALAKALKGLSPEQVQQTVIDSGLRGRGGAGFPTGKKWSFRPAQSARSALAHLQLRRDGTGHLQGSGAAGGQSLFPAGGDDPGILCHRCTSCLYLHPPRLRTGSRQPAPRRCTSAGKPACSARISWAAGFSCDIDVHVSAGRYICGEETALMNALEGKRANPRSKPPFPAVKGLWGGPTVVNNVESLANIPGIISNGPEWFKGLARTPEAAGMKLFCISGHVVNRACFELPLGMPLGEIIEGPCGGMRPGSSFKACLPGGASTPYFTSEHLACADGFRPGRQGRIAPRYRRHSGLRPEHLHGGSDAQPDALLCPRVVRLVYALPRGAALCEPCAGNHRSGQGQSRSISPSCRTMSSC